MNIELYSQLVKPASRRGPSQPAAQSASGFHQGRAQNVEPSTARRIAKSMDIFLTPWAMLLLPFFYTRAQHPPTPTTDPGPLLTRRPPLVGKEGGLTNRSSFKHSPNCHWNSVQLFFRSTFLRLTARPRAFFLFALPPTQECGCMCTGALRRRLFCG